MSSSKPPQGSRFVKKESKSKQLSRSFTKGEPNGEGLTDKAMPNGCLEHSSSQDGSTCNTSASSSSEKAVHPTSKTKASHTERKRTHKRHSRHSSTSDTSQRTESPVSSNPGSESSSPHDSPRASHKHSHRRSHLPHSKKNGTGDDASSPDLSTKKQKKGSQLRRRYRRSRSATPLPKLTEAKPDTPSPAAQSSPNSRSTSPEKVKVEGAAEGQTQHSQPQPSVAAPKKDIDEEAKRAQIEAQVAAWLGGGNQPRRPTPEKKDRSKKYRSRKTQMKRSPSIDTSLPATGRGSGVWENEKLRSAVNTQSLRIRGRVHTASGFVSQEAEPPKPQKIILSADAISARIPVCTIPYIDQLMSTK